MGHAGNIEISKNIRHRRGIFANTILRNRYTWYSNGYWCMDQIISCCREQEE